MYGHTGNSLIHSDVGTEIGRWFASFTTWCWSFLWTEWTSMSVLAALILITIHGYTCSNFREIENLWHSQNYQMWSLFILFFLPPHMQWKTAVMQKIQLQDIFLLIYLFIIPCHEVEGGYRNGCCPSVLPSYCPSVLPSFRPSVLPSVRPARFVSGAEHKNRERYLNQTWYST